jgi:hypothetical protein
MQQHTEPVDSIPRWAAPVMQGVQVGIRSSNHENKGQRNVPVYCHKHNQPVNFSFALDGHYPSSSIPFSLSKAFPFRSSHHLILFPFPLSFLAKRTTLLPIFLAIDAVSGKGPLPNSFARELLKDKRRKANVSKDREQSLKNFVRNMFVHLQKMSPLRNQPGSIHSR